MIYMQAKNFFRNAAVGMKSGFLEASGSYGRRLLGLRSTACTPSLNLPALGRRHTLTPVWLSTFQHGHTMPACDNRLGE